MQTPTQLTLGSTVYFEVPLYNLNGDGQLIDNATACSLAAVVMRDGAPSADIVTINKRGGSNVFDCWYDPAGEYVGENLSISLEATIDGTAGYFLKVPLVVTPAELTQDDIKTAVDASAVGITIARVDGMLELNNAETAYTLTSNAFENLSLSAVVLPLAIRAEDRHCGDEIKIFVEEEITVSPTVYGPDGITPMDLTGIGMKLIVWDRDEVEQINETATGTATGFSVTFQKQSAASNGWTWALRRDDGGERLAGGKFVIATSPHE